MAEIPSPQALDRQQLRTHLTIIKGYTQLAHRTASQATAGPDSVIAYLEIALAHIQHLVILVAEIEARDQHSQEGGAGGADGSR